MKCLNIVNCGQSLLWHAKINNIFERMKYFYSIKLFRKKYKVLSNLQLYSTEVACLKRIWLCIKHLIVVASTYTTVSRKYINRTEDFHSTKVVQTKMAKTVSLLVTFRSRVLPKLLYAPAPSTAAAAPPPPCPPLRRPPWPWTPPGWSCAGPGRGAWSGWRAGSAGGRAPQGRGGPDF